MQRIIFYIFLVFFCNYLHSSEVDYPQYAYNNRDFCNCLGENPNKGRSAIIYKPGMLPYFGDCAYYLCEHKTYLFANKNGHSGIKNYYIPLLTDQINIPVDKIAKNPPIIMKSLKCCDISSVSEVLVLPHDEQLIIGSDTRKNVIDPLNFAANFIFACNTGCHNEAADLLMLLNKKKCKKVFLMRVSDFLSKQGKNILKQVHPKIKLVKKNIEKEHKVPKSMIFLGGSVSLLLLFFFIFYSSDINNFVLFYPFK